MRLPGLVAGIALLSFARPLVGLEYDGFGRVWLVGLCLVVHLSLLWDENVGRNENSQPDDPTGCWKTIFCVGVMPTRLDYAVVCSTSFSGWVD